MIVQPSLFQRVLVPFVAVASLLLVLPLLVGMATVGALLVFAATLVLSRPVVQRFLLGRIRRQGMRTDAPPPSDVIDTTWTRVR